MSFLKKLFGGGSFEDRVAEADALFAQGRFGEAKLAYDRAADKAGGAPAERRAHVQARIAEIRDAIARSRLAEAAELESHGELDLARAELAGALETAASAEVARECERRIEALERRDARAAATAVEVTPDEIVEAIAANWEEEQAEEYERYGPRFREALLLAHAERFDEARARLEAVLAEAKDPHYLHFEIGQVRLLAGAEEEAIASFRAFLASIGPDEGGYARLMTHGNLAGLADERGDEEAAIAEWEAAIDALPDDPRPRLNLGVYLRRKGHAEAAAEVLEAVLAELDEVQPDVRVVEELALAKRDAGREDEAVQLLEQVIAHHVKLGILDYPPEGARALAELHEKRGDARRAADLWRALAKGSHVAGHLHYHREAARLLATLGEEAEARRLLQRAAELAGDDAETRAGVDAALRALG
jgi:tetratricopeptide (TPR) repeat protein